MAEKASSMNKIAGVLAVATLLVYLLSVGEWLSADIATILAWASMAAMWGSLNPSAKRQTTLLFGLGIGALLISAIYQVELDWNQVFAANVPLLAMFVAISFLSLTNPPASDEQLPTGRKAVITTALGTNLLGAVINLSVLFVFGDRLKRQNVLSTSQQVLLSRSFSAAAWWSPFFIATGVALTYAPGMEWKATFVPGAIMAVIGISFTVLEVIRNKKQSFSGYPIKAQSLLIPFTLAVSVLVFHHLLPSVSILILISILSLCGSVLLMPQRPRIPAIRHFVGYRLQAAGAQFSLFLGAGVFSIGIKSLLAINPDLVSLQAYSFGPLMFTLVSGAMIIIGLVGIHPVITITIISPILLPLEPNPTSLGFMYLSTWAISTGASPLSGIGLLMSARYGATSMGILRHNWHYVVSMWLIASGLNWWLFH
jgi:hypothetical protein